MVPTDGKMRVAVIGAGAAGLSSARHLTAAAIQCEVLEMTPQIGGVWVYTDEVGKDQYGFPIYSAMYKNLRINLPKEAMGFPDFPIPEQDKSYLYQPEILEFLNLYADHFKLRQLITFNRMVTEIRPLENIWQIKSIDKPTKEEIVDIYDAVMICNGHFNEPNVPKLPGEEKFTGKIGHSQQYRSPEPFKDQRVLVIGVGSSGVDLALDLSSVAKYVVLSHHSKEAVDIEYPANVSKKPDVLRIKDDEEVEFVNGSFCCFDAILYCTGYKYHFPFLHKTCGITVDDNHIQPLYKHVIHIEKPTMCFIGIPNKVCPFLMIDLQARFFCKFLTGSMSLPSGKMMRMDTEKDMQNRRTKGYTKRRAHFMGHDQQDYYDALAAAANTTPIAPVVSKLWKESMKNLYDDLQHFRENRYKIVDNESFVKLHLS